MKLETDPETIEQINSEKQKKLLSKHNLKIFKDQSLDRNFVSYDDGQNAHCSSKSRIQSIFIAHPSQLK